MKNTFLTFVLIFFASTVFGQSKTDSVKMSIYNEFMEYFTDCEAEIPENYEDYLLTFLSSYTNDSLECLAYNLLSEYYSAIDNDLSEKYADSAILSSKHFGSDYNLSMAYRNKGLSFYKRGEFENAVSEYLKAEEIAKKQKNYRLLYSVYNDMGMIYSDYSNQKVARKYYDLAIENAQICGNKDWMAELLVNKANSFYADENYDLILQYYDSALNAATNINTKIAIYNNIAYLQYYTGKTSEAHITYNTLIDLLEDNSDNYTYVLVLNNIISINILENKLDEAQKQLAIVDSISKANSYSDVRTFMYQNYHDLYVKLGNYEMSCYYLEEYISLNDSIYSFEFAQELSNIENKHLQEKAEMEMQQRDEQIKHQKYVNRILAFVIGGIVIFVVVILILFFQKHKLNKLLKATNSELLKRDEEISSNLEYAREIQLGCMNLSGISDRNYFVFDMPKTTVGGDFFISAKKNDAEYIFLGDCTGHGISGGFLSVLGIETINTAVDKYDSLPEIAQFINDEFFRVVSSAENLMGESLCLSAIRICGNELRFLGSKQKMWIASEGKIEEYKTANEILGNKRDVKFSEMVYTLTSGDVVFLSSDGYPDQFGGKENGKLKYNRFRNILRDCTYMSPKSAGNYLLQTLNSWKGKNEQTDDILVVGLYF